MVGEYNNFSSVDNLELAWMRIKSDSSNVSYKNYYRNLFSAYETTFEENLEILSNRLRGYSYNPSDILRFYIPKQSGLHRPITFLHLDDMIVYQAFGNVILEEYIDKRENLENINVFSNLLNRNKDKNIFLFKKWQEGYVKFLREIKRYFYNGNKWVAHFDLAAYYDTIDHGVLINEFQAESNFNELFKKCLKKWSTHGDIKLGHGIPQGPITSNLLAEIYLLPIDKALNQNNSKYVRYVDDIKIYGKSREEVLEGIILLEKECKERGLIPQTTKYEIIKAKNINQATGKFPSLKAYEKKEIFSNSTKTYKHFRKAINEENFDSSKVNYILKAGKKHRYVLKWVLRNLNKRPELSDGFHQYLLHYRQNYSIGKTIYDLALSKPTSYEYAEGKYWDLLSYFEFEEEYKQFLLKSAITRLNDVNHNYSLKLGLYKFLCSGNSDLVFEHLKNEKSSLIQMMVIPHAPLIDEEYSELLSTLMNVYSYEPALIALNNVISKNKLYMLTGMGLPENDQSCVIENCLGKKNKIDSIGQIMNETYGVPYCDKWDILLDSEYEHANILLFNACSSYNIDGNSWIGYKDAFNEIIIRNFIELLNSKRSNIKWPSLYSNNGEKLDYGVLLDKQNKLCKHYYKIVKPFRTIHLRRNMTPVSHAYDKKSNELTTFINSNDKKNYFHELKNSYNFLIKEIERL